jgi:hypothetical protein
MALDSKSIFPYKESAPRRSTARVFAGSPDVVTRGAALPRPARAENRTQSLCPVFPSLECTARRSGKLLNRTVATSTCTINSHRSPRDLSLRARRQKPDLYCKSGFPGGVQHHRAQERRAPCSRSEFSVKNLRAAAKIWSTRKPDLDSKSGFSPRSFSDIPFVIDALVNRHLSDRRP